MGILSGADIERIVDEIRPLFESNNDVATYTNELAINGTDSSFKSNKEILLKLAQASTLSIENKVDLIKIAIYSSFENLDKINIIKPMFQNVTNKTVFASELTIYELFELVNLNDSVLLDVALDCFNSYDDLVPVFSHDKSKVFFNSSENIKKLLQRLNLGVYVISSLTHKRLIHDKVKKDRSFALWFREFMLNDINKNAYVYKIANISISNLSSNIYNRFKYFLCIGQLYVPAGKKIIIKDIDTKEELFNSGTINSARFVDVDRVYFDKIEILDSHIFSNIPSGNTMPIERQIISC